MEKPHVPHLEYLSPDKILSQSNDSVGSSLPQMVFLGDHEGTPVAIKKKGKFSAAKEKSPIEVQMSRSKLTSEVKLIEHARNSGIRTPKILSYSLEDNHIKMEYLESFETAITYFKKERTDEESRCF